MRSLFLATSNLLTQKQTFDELLRGMVRIPSGRCVGLKADRDVHP
jgi:hypothetical protein